MKHLLEKVYIFKQVFPILPERTGPLPGILLFCGNFGAKRGTGASLPSLSASGIM